MKIERKQEQTKIHRKLRKIRIEGKLRETDENLKKIQKNRLKF